MTRAVVTGSTGFAGEALVAELRARGLEVVRASARALPDGVRADLASPGAWRALLARVRPDVVFHLHGASDPADARAAVAHNVRPATALLAAAADVARPATILVVGSAAEYGPVDEADLPVREDAPLRPTSILGRSKAVQTRRALRAARRGVRVVVARPTNLVGPGAPPTTAAGAFARGLAAVTRGEAAVLRTGPLDVARDFVDVRDAVRAFAALAATPRAVGHVVHVASGRATALREVVALLCAAAGVECPVEEDPARASARSRATRSFAADPTRLEALTGERPRIPLATSLRDLLTSLGVPLQRGAAPSP